MPSPRPAERSRECNCVSEYLLDEDERLLRCAHFNDWSLVLVAMEDSKPTVYVVQSNVPIWGEFYSLDLAEAEQNFAFAEARFHEEGV